MDKCTLQCFAPRFFFSITPSVTFSIWLFACHEWHMPEWKVAYAEMESGIYQNGKWHLPKWKVAYTRVESGIYQSGIPHIYMWNISIFSLYNPYCMIDHDIDAGQCSRGRAQTQAFPAKCLDKSFVFQCVNLVPQEWASSMVYWTLRWAYHTSHRAP